MWAVARLALLCAGILQSSAENATDANYHVGVGMWDVTGPAAEVVMMGYGSSEHSTNGIHMRLHARAFIFVDPDADKRTAFINVDTWSSTETLIQQLEERLLAEYGGLYNRHNVILAGTHTHHGPAGNSAYYLYQFSSYGYNHQSAQAIIDGVVQAFRIAHNSIRPSKVFIGNGPVDNTTVPGCPMPNCASINRSPTAYLENPEAERAKYDGDTERNMDLIKIVDAATGEPRGALNWFAVHPTNMPNTVGFISPDNKGAAEYFFENAMNGPTHGRGPFVAAFAQGASGDVSPNTNGSWCVGSAPDWISCDNPQSVCWENGKPHNSKCLGHGPGKDMYESTKIIGQRQFIAAKHIFDRASKPLGSGIDHRVRFVDLTAYWTQLENGRWVTTCKPAMGTAFAAGTTDGPSEVDDFGQNMTPTSGFLQFVATLLAPPPADMQRCHEPKKILLYTGGMNAPYAYMPSVMGFQLVRIGDLVVAAVPFEFTTMAGRRTREAIKKVFVDGGVLSENGTVVINNVASGYAGYIVTFEEYQHQRYEAGSTAYGPHAHRAVQEILVGMAQDMASGENHVPPGTPPDIPKPDQLWEGQSGVVVDDPPIGGSFGDVEVDVAPGAYAPLDVVKVSIWGAHPKNDVRLNGSFSSVWRRNDTDGSWALVADDNDWETWYHWERVGISASRVTITWEIPEDCPEGNYSLYYSGDAKHGGRIMEIHGSSSVFEVIHNVTHGNVSLDAPPEEGGRRLRGVARAQYV